MTGGGSTTSGRALHRFPTPKKAPFPLKLSHTTASFGRWNAFSHERSLASTKALKRVSVSGFYSSPAHSASRGRCSVLAASISPSAPSLWWPSPLSREISSSRGWPTSSGTCSVPSWTCSTTNPLHSRMSHTIISSISLKFASTRNMLLAIRYITCNFLII